MLSIKHLQKTFYPGTPEENRVFKDFNLETQDHGCIAILGPNGCGKSTLFNLVTGGLQADAGKIELNGLDLTPISEVDRAKYIGRVMQDPSKGVSPNLTILENLYLSRLKGQKFGFSSLVKKDIQDELVDKLASAKLGLENKLNTQVKYLSGGQRQTVSLIMATYNRPDLLLLDEHTAALDPKTSYLVLEKTRDLIDREKILTLMITHNLRTAIDFSDRIIMMLAGKIVLDVPGKSLSEEELTRIYHEKIDKQRISLAS
ncbi:MAG: ATP-binding cassette domain-containing protein [Tissierellia bacterium]|nr:ATP-binding cassette domain-containing protein [Tissierellia bacterium]